jgi:UDP-galactopyranose mutase
MKYDYIIIGSGLFGSVFANQAKIAGKKVLVIEKRNHIGGNVYTENKEGINIHKYGGHIWHTTSKKIHNYMCQFCEFNNFTNRVKANYNGEIYSLPINLMTLYQLWGVQTPEEAISKINEVKIPIKNPSNLEDWVLSEVGEEIYTKFIKGYTTKQWNKDPRDLPSSIIKRLPIRFNFNDRWFPDNHIYEGIPVGGYTQIIEKMLSDVEVKLNEDFFENQKTIESLTDKIIYTGPLDKFFNYSEGMLEYRSLRFEEELHRGDYQGNAAINYTSLDVPYTRIIEHKHFEFLDIEKTIITKEYPQDYSEKTEPYYPINNDTNNKIANMYRDMSKNLTKYKFGGRLATYNYYDMHQVVASALSLSEKLL